MRLVIHEGKVRSSNTKDNNNTNDDTIDNTSGNTNDNKTNNVTQRIENNNIVICIPASNTNNIDVSVSNDGLTLVVEMNDSSTKQYIQLVQKVNPSSMIAKYSKKKSIITITAQTNNNNRKLV